MSSMSAPPANGKMGRAGKGAGLFRSRSVAWKQQVVVMSTSYSHFQCDIETAHRQIKPSKGPKPGDGGGDGEGGGGDGGGEGGGGEVGSGDGGGGDGGGGEVEKIGMVPDRRCQSPVNQ